MPWSDYNDHVKEFLKPSPLELAVLKRLREYKADKEAS